MQSDLLHRQVVTDEREGYLGRIIGDFWDEIQHMSSHSAVGRAGGHGALVQVVLLSGWEAIRNPPRSAGMLRLLLGFHSHTQQRRFKPNIGLQKRQEEILIINY